MVRSMALERSDKSGDSVAESGGLGLCFFMVHLRFDKGAAMPLLSNREGWQPYAG